MKKSTKVVLTLLVPAMTAHGCSNQSVQVPASAFTSASHVAIKLPVKCSCGHSFVVSGEQVGKQVQCPNCDQTLTVPTGGTQAATQATPYYSTPYYSRHSSPYYSRPYYSRYRSNSSYGGWFGEQSSQSASSPPVTSGNHTTGTSHPPSNSHVSYGGFGGTSAHFSGGS